MSERVFDFKEREKLGGRKREKKHCEPHVKIKHNDVYWLQMFAIQCMISAEALKLWYNFHVIRYYTLHSIYRTRARSIEKIFCFPCYVCTMMEKGNYFACSKKRTVWHTCFVYACRCPVLLVFTLKRSCKYKIMYKREIADRSPRDVNNFIDRTSVLCAYI